MTKLALSDEILMKIDKPARYIGKQIQEKINAGILLARKRLIEKTKKEDGELVVVRDGKVVRIKAKDLK